VAQGEAVWVYEVPRLYPAVSNGRFTLYVAKEGRWTGLGRAAGTDVGEDGKKSDWYYAFSETFPVDRPSPIVAGAIGNVTVQLYGGSGPVRYRFDAAGNGGGPDTTRDVFLIERHIVTGRETEIERRAMGWPPILRVGATPGEASSSDFTPANAVAGQVALVKPLALTGNGRLSGSASWKQRYKGTEYVIRLRWSSKQPDALFPTVSGGWHPGARPSRRRCPSARAGR